MPVACLCLPESACVVQPQKVPSQQQPELYSEQQLVDQLRLFVPVGAHNKRKLEQNELVTFFVSAALLLLPSNVPALQAPLPELACLKPFPVQSCQQL